MPQDGVLTNDDLDFLQGVYDAAAKDLGNIDDATMHHVVNVLILHYRAGERDKAKLIVLARKDLRRAAG